MLHPIQHYYWVLLVTYWLPLLLLVPPFSMNVEAVVMWKSVQRLRSRFSFA